MECVLVAVAAILTVAASDKRHSCRSRMAAARENPALLHISHLEIAVKCVRTPQNADL